MLKSSWIQGLVAICWSVCGMPKVVDATLSPFADSIVVRKADRLLLVYSHGRAIQTSRIALGDNPVGPKVCEGDRRTPEGNYHVAARNEASHYHRSLLLSYPSAEDRRKAQANGCSPGGAIMIHGLPNGMGQWGARLLAKDWTWGCVSLTDEGVDSVMAVARVGTPVVIHP